MNENSYKFVYHLIEIIFQHKHIDMKNKLTLISTAFMSLLLAFFSLSVQAQSEAGSNQIQITTPDINILSGFKGGSYYEMAMDMQRMTRKTLGKPVMAEESIQFPLIENGDTVFDDNGDVVMEEKTIQKPTGDTLDFIKVRDSDGAYYNFIKISKADVDITFIQYDVLLYESVKDLRRKFKKTEDLRVLLPLGSEAIHLITTKNSGIKTFKDLKKKRVGIGSSLQGTNITAKYIKEKTGAKWEDVEIPFDKAFRALFNGDIDAFFFVGTAPVSKFANLPKSLKDRIAMIEIPVNEDLKEAYGEQIEINSSMYSWVEKPVKTYAVKVLLVSSIQGQTPEQAKKIHDVLKIVKQEKDKNGYFVGWKNVKFAKDPAIEWDYHPAVADLVK